MPPLPHPYSSPHWVSKSDLTQFVRCPYAFWLLDRGEITFEDTVDEFQAQLLQDGVGFQDGIEATAARVEIPPEGLTALFRQEHTLLGTPLFENPKLKIYGRPDGIQTAGGVMVPIEIKSHKDVQRTDALELAFYWLLLEPYRTRRVADRLGLLILRRGGRPEVVEVPLPQIRFDDVRRLLQQVRDARRWGVRPRICGCQVCSQLRRDEVHEAAQAAKDLTLIFGIGYTYAAALEEMGLASWDKLLGCDSEFVAGCMRERKYGVSRDMVERWKRHAESWYSQQPVYFGGPDKYGDAFISLDLEYEPDSLIWLVGVGVVRGEERDYSILWADDAAEEAANLLQLSEIVADNPDLPVMTWAGEGADVPQLRKAASRLGLGDRLEPLIQRHLDLYVYAQRCLRLPIPTLRLKDVAEYFGIPRINSVRAGLQALMDFHEYCRASDPKRKQQLRTQLTDYNHDDVETLIEVAQRVRALAPS